MIHILFENDNYVVCIKPKGMSSESDLPEKLKEQLKSEIYTLHRLDVPVSGVMVYAKNKQTAGDISKKIAEGTDFEKTYLAVCEGTFDEKSGIMEDILFKDSRKNKSFVVKRERKGTKKAVLEYEILGEATIDEKIFSLAKITLKTGRSHQIRVQFASRKHPLLGDGKYGSKTNSDIALFSYKIKLNNEIFSGKPACEFPWSCFDII